MRGNTRTLAALNTMNPSEIKQIEWTNDREHNPNLWNVLLHEKKIIPQNMRDICIEKYDLWLTQPEFYVWRQHGISFMLCIAENHAFINKNTGWRYYGPKNRLPSIARGHMYLASK